MTELKSLDLLDDRMHFLDVYESAVRGTIIEDIDNFNRVSEMFHILQSPQSRLNDSIEGFGYNASY
jgi:hypothetical protein